MNVATSQFPIFRLPSKALKHTFRCFEVLGLMKLAICSEKSKRLINSLNLKAKYFHVVVDNKFGLKINFSGLQWIDIDCPANASIKNDGGLPTNIEITQRTNDIKNSTELNNNYDMTKWMQILISTFHLRKIDDFMVFRQSDRFDSKLVRDLFKNMKIGYIFIQTFVPVRFSQQLLIQFSHVTEEIDVQDPFQYSGNRYTILRQNFAFLHLRNARNISLDHLFLMNSVEIHLSRIELSDKALNVFLKHWIMGSNPRLKKITMKMLRTNVNQSIVLKGISHQIVPAEQQGEERYDILRQDGTKATLHFQRTTLDTLFRMTVSN